MIGSAQVLHLLFLSLHSQKSDPFLGKLFADTSLFLTCSMILSVFDISKVYKNGVAVEPTLGQTNGTIRSVGLAVLFAWSLPDGVITVNRFPSSAR